MDASPFGGMEAWLATIHTTPVASALAALSRVDKVDVSQRIKRAWAHCYVVEVFLKPDTKAIRRQRAARDVFQRAEPPRESDYQVDHGFAAFAALRDAVAVCVEHSRGGNQCAYCWRLSTFLQREGRLPSAGVRMVVPKRAKMRALAVFVERLLELTTSSEAAACSSCRACAHVPLLLEQFLRRPRESSLGII